MWTGYSIVGLLIAGIVLGILGRLVAPGKQKIPFWLTIIAGIVGALLGNVLASAVGVRETDGIDWIRHIFQIIVAAVAVVLAASLYGRSRSRT
ncbi:MAG: GlsB/YeaQ/YmgE family stress response membrane protein [Actinophytocola sp.]|uniref:GlsB/YeaQ/YmgE family stress response membrane protein n=1 Tax=Actinophytocola sp. TaxID=1872138 RepID=UPI003D6B5298